MSESKITIAIRQAGKAFIPFLVAGDPDLDTTLETMKEMARNGAAIIEVGIPFSDPIAEGVVIQAADLRAMKNGITIDMVCDIVARFKEEFETPVVFLTYANPVFRYGYDAFCQRCVEAGIEGFIIPDMPYEESGELRPFADKYGLDLITLISPVSRERVRKLAKQATGYIYLVSSLGVTGVRSNLSLDIASIVEEIRTITDTPVAVGFGIGTPEQARQMSLISDGAIVGSAIVKRMEEHGTESPAVIGKYTKSMAEAVASEADE